MCWIIDCVTSRFPSARTHCWCFLIWSWTTWSRSKVRSARWRHASLMRMLRLLALLVSFSTTLPSGYDCTGVRFDDMHIYGHLCCCSRSFCPDHSLTRSTALVTSISCVVRSSTLSIHVLLSSSASLSSDAPVLGWLESFRFLLSSHDWTKSAFSVELSTTVINQHHDVQHCGHWHCELYPTVKQYAPKCGLYITKKWK